MTSDTPNDVSEHGSSEAFEGNEARRERIGRLIDEGREAELSEDDYTFAIQHGLIEG